MSQPVRHASLITLPEESPSHYESAQLVLDERTSSFRTNRATDGGSQNFSSREGYLTEVSHAEQSPARDSSPPESYIREIKPAITTLQTFDFASEELTKPLWRRPPPPPPHPTLDPKTRLESPPVPQPPLITFFRWLTMALWGN